MAHYSSLVSLRSACLLALLILGSCDHMGTAPEISDAARIAAAKAYYEHAIAHPPAETPAQGFPFSLVQSRPPDWTTAQVLQHPGGNPVVAAQLRGNALRPANEALFLLWGWSCLR